MTRAIVRGPRRRASKRKADASRVMTRRALIADLVRRELRPGEVAIPSASSDMTPCGCVHHQCARFDCTVVGRRRVERLDRCLVCSAVWRSRDVGIHPRPVAIVPAEVRS